MFTRSPSGVSRACSPFVLVLAMAGGVAQAAPISYVGSDNPRGTLSDSLAAQSSFLAALGTSGTDDLEGFANFTSNPTLSFGATGVTATTQTGFVAAFAILATSGNNVLLDQGPASDADPGIPDVFTFSRPVQAFGAFFSNVGDAAENAISFVLENTTLGTSQTVDFGTFGPGREFSSVLFLGVTDSAPFDRVSIVEAFDFDGALLDDITAGYLVPEPASWMLAALGLAGLAAFRRRRATGPVPGR